MKFPTIAFASPFSKKICAIHQSSTRNLFVHYSLPTFSAQHLTKEQTRPSSSAIQNKLSEKLKQSQEELENYKPDSTKYRLIKLRIANLREEIFRVGTARLEDPKDLVNISNMMLAPHLVTLEVISNGTTHLRPSVVLRTPTRCYLFNCPEGTARFIHTFRIRPNTISDFFATKAHWDNTGGIASMLLEKFNPNDSVRLHGPKHIKSYLEGQRPFMDVDFGHVNYPVCCEELSYEREQFEDSTLHVRYIPLVVAPSTLSPSPPNSPSSTARGVERGGIKMMGNVDVAFLVKLKGSSPSIDPFKLIALKIPKGPHIAQLKAGTPITLEDGRVIQPSDVYSDKMSAVSPPDLLFVELDSLDKLNAIHANELLKDFMGDDRRLRQLHYIVHFTRPALFNSSQYCAWMRSFGTKCRHLVLNGTGPPMTMNDGVYKSQENLHTIFPQAYPEIYPAPEHYEGKVFTHNDVCDDLLADQPSTADGMGPIFLGSLFQRFPLRGVLPKFGADDPNVLKLDYTVKELDFRLENMPGLAPELVEFRKYLSAALDARTVPDPYPQVAFLGTASAVPAKYRNVSSYLLQLSPSSTMMIDCGDGTYGQLRTLFGPEQCAKLLASMHVIFITHSHLDHTNGLFTMVQERCRAFTELGLPYRPLVLACNRTIRKITSTYAKSYQDIDRFVHYVDLPYIYIEDTVGINPKAVNSLPSPGAVTELTKHFPNQLFSPKAWNLRSVKAIQVRHTRAASGFVFECEQDGRRVVFSGDTKPCPLLEQHGREADVLVHECTFEDGMEADALRKRHSTMRQAFDSAQRMRAKHVFFTHFSSRYARCPPLPDYLLEAGNFAVANDYMLAPFDLLPVFPKLLPVFRELFREELFTNHMKSMKRKMERPNVDDQQQKFGQLKQQKYIKNVAAMGSSRQVETACLKATKG
uniref:ribonuclease Z n=1 Tax=Globodera rostochiensis TaxID=31243 RepID=A0A914HFC7_GLORO